MSKRVGVNFTDEQYGILQLNDELGNSDLDVVKNLTIAWFSEKSFILQSLKQRFLESRYHD